MLLRPLLPTLTFGLIAVFLTGCGGGGGGSNPAHLERSTPVTVLATSTGNDQIAQFNLFFNSITLTSQSGNTVTLLPSYEYDEFIHLNGQAEPLFTSSIPQDTYTSGTAVLGPTNFTCIGLNSGGGLLSDEFAYGYVPGSVQINLPKPITVSGNSMTLSLNLQVSQSASWAASSCASSNAVQSYAITPTFDLGPASAAQTTMHGLAGQIASVNTGSGSFTVTAANGSSQEITESGSTVTSTSPVWTVKPAAGAAFQGASGISALAAGMPVEFDAVLQSDGSLQASRIAVQDTNTTDLTHIIGPVGQVYSYAAPPAPLLFVDDAEEQGTLLPWLGLGSFTFGDANFQVSGQLANFNELPFTPTFNASTMVAGQRISTISHNASFPNGGSYASVTSIMLISQTINGTISAVGSQGSFTTYTITLAPYDVFPIFADQSPGQQTVLSNPNTVVVYADTNTQMLNDNPIAVGSVMRFSGLVFNDNGTLRMDCAQIDDGVPE